MKNMKRIIVMSLMLVSGLSNQLCAKVRAITLQRDFEQNVAHKGLCVALFYNVNDKRNAPLRQDNKQLQRMFEDVSAKESYDAADIVFIKINTARKEFDTLVNQYNITQVPQFIVFSDGRLIKDHDKAVVLSGFVTREALESFIDRYCGGEIKNLNIAKDVVQQKRIQEEKKPWLPYFYPRDIFVRDYDPAQRNME